MGNNITKKADDTDLLPNAQPSHHQSTPTQQPPHQTTTFSSNPIIEPSAKAVKLRNEEGEASSTSSFQISPFATLDSESSEEMDSSSSQKKSNPSSSVTKTDSSDDITDSIPLELSPEDIQTGEFLGEGVYSEVYKGWSNLFFFFPSSIYDLFWTLGYCYGTQVAVKKFKNQGFDKELLAQIRKEIRIMKYSFFFLMGI